jgi:hypothetical protein
MNKAGLVGLLELPRELSRWNELYRVAMRLEGFTVSAPVLAARKRAEELIARYEEEQDRPELLDEASALYKPALAELEGSLVIHFIEFRRRAVERLSVIVVRPDPFEIESRFRIREDLKTLGSLTVQSKFNFWLALKLAAEIGPALKVLEANQSSYHLGADPRYRNHNSLAVYA